ncbi:CHAT domain-containing protein [Mucilaginibacter sp.]|uniref:CHAT domain-containing protein n=1 Tax=Mucilaginibacter sp. TaxID=1882438 RepID=UPI00262E1DC7|nr:CHAT domain-containing protein [Mucilaginibacter sp.]MDB4921827.1 hypothetical protein [Mucilaginibacter sp.]
MLDLKTELLSKFTDISIHEAIFGVYAALPSNKFMIGLKAQSKTLEKDYKSKLITRDVYIVESENLRSSLFFLIDELNDADLKKVFIQVVKNVDGGNPSNENKSILFIAASPKDLDNLQIAFEYAAIKNVLVSSIDRDKFLFEDPVLAATIDAMVDAINISKPAIIHFSGHAGKKGIILSDRDNNAELIPTGILDNYFGTFHNGIDCVFLNACYSVEQATAISKHVKYVVGMNCPIGDDAAIIFSEAFYRCLFNDNDLNYKKAFKQACIKLQLKAVEECTTPDLWGNGEKIV